MSSVASTIATIRDEVSQQFFELDTPQEAIWLGVLAAEHVFVIGEPGNGKTEVSEESLERIVGDPQWVGPKGELGRMLWRLQFLKTTPLEKLAGMYDVPAIREKGEYHHNITGFLPTARYAVADELGKASPISQDPLLSILAGSPMLTNDQGKRKFDNNANTMRVPLLTMVATSNEELNEEEQGAIWDRMTLRCRAEEPKDPDNRLKLVYKAMNGPSNGATSHTTLDFADLYQAISDDIPNINIPHDVAWALAMDIPAALAKKGLRQSPRRISKAGRVLQASAFLNGRSQVEMDDLAALRFMFWDKAEQIDEIERVVLTSSNKALKEALEILDGVEAEAARLAAIDPNLAVSEVTRIHFDAASKLKASKDVLGNMIQDAIAHNKSTTKLREIEARLDQVRNIARSALSL